MLPVRQRLSEALVTLRGAEDVPPSRFGLSSLRLLSPRLAVPLWRGRFVVRRRAIVTNLFNHTQTPIEEGWSVRRTRTRDFRGRTLTYDSHNGTDLAVPRGTLVAAPAPAVVARVHAEFNRGGLKVMLDHGEGLCTCTAHLARVLVTEGSRLQRGEPFAVSGYSGLDGLVSFPFGIPHIHFNTWLDGEPVDPFGSPDEPSLWIGETPEPAQPHIEAEPFEPGRFDARAVEAAIGSCRTASARERLAWLPTPEARATHLLWERNYYPTRFPSCEPVYREPHPRRARLSLPFPASDIDGVVFADEL